MKTKTLILKITNKERQELNSELVRITNMFKKCDTGMLNCRSQFKNIYKIVEGVNQAFKIKDRSEKC